MATRRRAWLFAVAYVAMGVAWMFATRRDVYIVGAVRMHPTGPMLAIGAVDTLSGIVLFSPLLLGGTLAEDRASGLSRLLLPRCGSRTSWVSSKFLAAFFVASAYFVTFGLLLAAAARLLSGWNMRTLSQTVGVHTRLATHPIALVVISCVALALAATATASLSTVAAFFVRSTAVSLLVPVLAVFAAAFVLPPELNPYVRASFLGVFFGWNTLGGVFAYWGVVLGLSWVGCVALARWRED
ncbi:MAG TPA: hypothetical protein VFG89_10280 [Coriobacteriia bacterium]|nr:hypothetical protein [Coriobacteriia bacterium]